MNDTDVKAASWDQFIGQPNLKERLETHIRASIMERRPLDHILLSGPPGSGKTTLAELIALTVGDPTLMLTMPLDRKMFMYKLSQFSGGILFLDEVHSLPKKDQEMLLPLLGRGVYIDSKTGAEMPFPWLTVIAATTERDKLIAPLHDRFSIRPEFEPYTDEDLGLVVGGMAERVSLPMSVETAEALGRASGGIPRNAKQFVFAAVALATVNGEQPTADTILDFCKVDRDGLTELHRRYLEIIDSQGGKAGQRTLEGLLRIPAAYCRELERLLIEHRLITYSSTGRILTPTGKARIGGEVRKAYRRE